MTSKIDKIATVVGKKYHRLTVQSFHGTKYTGIKRKTIRYEMLCSCECGRSVITDIDRITRGDVKSCGCLLTEFNMRRHKAPGQAAAHTLFLDYVKGATKRGYKFTLTDDEFIRLTSSNCHWCGITPAQKIGSSRFYGQYTYNGIDRVDNTEGYTTENCVPCCFICNRAKSTMSTSAFIEWAKRLNTHLDQMQR